MTVDATENTADTVLNDYLSTLGAAFQRACQTQPRHSQRLAIAGARVEMRFAGETLPQVMAPALAHLDAPGDSAPPDIVLHLWDGPAPATPPPFSLDAYRRFGQRAVAYRGSVALMYAPVNKLLYAYDRATRHGFFWTMDAAQLSIYERAAPVQTLFHWALAEYDWQIIHAAAIGTEQGGVLLIGSSGAGKSTTALSCLGQTGLRFLSDDKCLMRLQPASEAFALFSSAKIKADMLERLPHFRSLLAGWDEDYKANKGLVFLHPTYADHLASSLPIKAILLPAVAHQPHAALHCVAPTQVFRQLGPSTVIWLPGAEADNYRFTAELARRLPCYRLDLATDPQRNVDAIGALIARL